MVRRLAHRGPDASGLRTFERCTLGHTRLRIIDVSVAGDQPMANEDGTIWVVFNGEIYNFPELRAALVAAGHRFRSGTDTEVLVHLYEEHGAALAERLRGMFAFAVWDEPRQRLVLCRDRLGIKPLYYRSEGAQLSFASEVQALAEPAEPLDTAALADYLRLGWIPGPATVRLDIRELPPGHSLTWEAGTFRLARYSPPLFSGPRTSAPSPAALGEVLGDAVARHMVADVPVGVFLSSGVDSAVVARLASRCSPGVRAYTVGFDTGPDEVGEATLLAEQLGIDHTVVRITGRDVLSSLDCVIATMDQPTVDGVNSWIISRAVRQAGLVVALSGLGGDELFGGYSTFRHVPRLAAAARGARVLPARLRGLPEALAATASRTAHSRGRRALEAVAYGGWATAYGAVRGPYGRRELEAVWPRVRSAEHTPPTEGVDGGQLGGWARVGRLELANYLPFQLLRDTDCMSMAHALEVRVPLLDDEVVSLAVAGMRADGESWTKARLVSAVDPALHRLAQRPKQTFTLPFDHWMRGELQERVLASLVTLGEAGLGFDRRALTELWYGFGRRQVGWRTLWALAVLGMWLDAHTGP